MIFLAMMNDCEVAARCDISRVLRTFAKNLRDLNCKCEQVKVEKLRTRLIHFSLAPRAYFCEGGLLGTTQEYIAEFHLELVL
jgi:hypothetical protein